MRLEKINFSIETLFGDTLLMLMDVSPYFEYKDGKKTENQLGFKYEVVEDTSFERFTVKVASKQPVITADDLAKSKSRVYVEFENSRGHIYRTPVGSIEVSFSADAVKIVGA